MRRLACVLSTVIIALTLVRPAMTLAEDLELPAPTEGTTLPATRPSPPAPQVPAIYQQIVDEYMAGDWDAVDKDLSKKGREVAAIPKVQAADITYIKQAMAEGRPAWWKQVKQGRKMLFQAKLWDRTIPMTFDPDQGSALNFSSTGGVLALTVRWTAGDMDSTEAADAGFTQGGATNGAIWNILETGEVYAGFTPQVLQQQNNADKKRLDAYVKFRGTVTGAYFGTPRARAWGNLLAMSAFAQSTSKNSNFIPRKPLGALLMVEIAGHPWRYPSLTLPALAPPENVEQVVAGQLSGQFTKSLTFAEDKALREAVKDFAKANTTAVYTAGRVTLPNKVQVDVNPDQDKELSQIRETWLKGALTHPTTAPSVTPGARGP